MKSEFGTERYTGNTIDYEGHESIGLRFSCEQVQVGCWMIRRGVGCVVHVV